MSRTQRKYDQEYKIQAVKLAKEIGGAVLESIASELYPITIYGYTDESKTPVKHTSSLVLSQELYKLLRGE